METIEVQVNSSAANNYPLRVRATVDLTHPTVNSDTQYGVQQQITDSSTADTTLSAIGDTYYVLNGDVDVVAGSGQVTNTPATDGQTSTHTINYSVQGVSNDGNTDTFYVRLPDAYAGAISPNSAAAEYKSDGASVSITSSVSVVDGGDNDGNQETLTFSVSPSDTSRPGAVALNVSVNTDLTHPGVASSTTYGVIGRAVDSSNGTDTDQVATFDVDPSVASVSNLQDSSGTATNQFDTVGDTITLVVGNNSVGNAAATNFTAVHNFTGESKQLEGGVIANNGAVETTFPAAKTGDTAITLYVNGTVNVFAYNTTNYFVNATDQVLHGTSSEINGEIYEYYEGEGDADNRFEDDINVDFAIYNTTNDLIGSGDTGDGQFTDLRTFDDVIENASRRNAGDLDYPNESGVGPKYKVYVLPDPGDTNSPTPSSSENNGTARIDVRVDFSGSPNNASYFETITIDGDVFDGLGNGLPNYVVEVRDPTKNGDPYNPGQLLGASSKEKNTTTAQSGGYALTAELNDAGEWRLGTDVGDQSAQDPFIQYETITVGPKTIDVSVEAAGGNFPNFPENYTVSVSNDGSAVDTDPVLTGTGSLQYVGYVNVTGPFNASTVSTAQPQIIQVFDKNATDGVVEAVHVDTNSTGVASFDATIARGATGDVTATLEHNVNVTSSGTSARSTPIEGLENAQDAAVSEESPDYVGSDATDINRARALNIVEFDVQDEQIAATNWTSLDVNGNGSIGDARNETIKVLPHAESSSQRLIGNDRVGNDTNFGFDDITDYRFKTEIRNASNIAYTFGNETLANVSSVSITGAGVDKTITSANTSGHTYYPGNETHAFTFRPVEKDSQSDNVTLSLTVVAANGTNVTFEETYPTDGLRIDQFEVGGTTATSVTIGDQIDLDAVVTEADGEFVNNGKVRVSQDNSAGGRDVLGAFDARTQNTNDGVYEFALNITRTAVDTNGDGIAEADAPLVFTAYQYEDADDDQALEQNEVTTATVRTLPTEPKDTLQIEFTDNEDHEYLSSGEPLTAGVQYDNVTITVTDENGEPVDLTAGAGGVSLGPGAIGTLVTVDGHNTTIDVVNASAGVYDITDINASNGDALDARGGDGAVLFNGTQTGDYEIDVVTPNKSNSDADGEGQFSVADPIVEADVTQVTLANGTTFNVSNVDTMTYGISRNYTVEATVYDAMGQPLNGSMTEDGYAPSNVVVTLENGISSFNATTSMLAQSLPQSLRDGGRDDGVMATPSLVDNWRGTWQFYGNESEGRWIRTGVGFQYTREYGGLMFSSEDIDGDSMVGIDANGTFEFVTIPGDMDNVDYLVSENTVETGPQDSGTPAYRQDLDNDGERDSQGESDHYVTARADDDGPSADKLIVNVLSDRGATIPEQEFETDARKRTVGPTDENASVLSDEEGIVLPVDVTNDVRVEAFPADNNDAALPSITVGISDVDPISERTVFTNTSAADADELSSNFTQGQLGRFSFTPSGTGEDIIKVRASFQNQQSVTDGSADVVERIDVRQSTDTLVIQGLPQQTTVGETISGQVVLAGADTPAENASVAVSFPDGTSDTVVTGSNGEFSLQIDQSGAYRFQASKVGFSPSSEVTVSAGDVVFDVRDLQAPSEATIGDTISVNATVENIGAASGTKNVSFRLDLNQDGTIDADNETLATQQLALNAGAQQTVEFDVDTTGLANGTYTHGVFTADAQQTAQITLVEEAPEQATASVTFEDQTVQNGSETVTVASANYTLANGTAGDYVVAVHVVYDNGSISGPVGYSAEQTGAATDVSVDLNASAAMGDGLDAISENVTLRAMLHETSDSGPFGGAIQIDGSLVTDDADITVEPAGPTGPGVLPGQSNPAQDPDGDGLYEDVNGDGEFNILDVSIFLDIFEDVDSEDVQFLDFTGDGQINILDVSELLNET